MSCTWASTSWASKDNGSSRVPTSAKRFCVDLSPERSMTKVLVLYYSSYGHVEEMANAVAEGVLSAGASVELKRVPETTPTDVAKAAHFKLDQSAPIATIDELPDYDAIIIRSPTRFGRMASQMAAFLDQAGGLWMRGALHGKVG